MITKIELGKVIRQTRLAKKLTQQDLAYAAGYRSKNTIHEIETGIKFPSIDCLNRLAEVLGISPSLLLILSSNDESAKKVKEILWGNNGNCS